MAQLLEGKKAAQAITDRVRTQTDKLRAKGIVPTLAILRAGEHPSDLSYERGALKRAELAGVEVRQFVFAETVSQEVLLSQIEKINQDDSIHGALIFRPLPQQIDDEAVRAALLPSKDVDGITEGSLAGIFTGARGGFAPCTARACMELLDCYGIELEGKRVAVLGRSLVIGKPVSMMALAKNATVAICHSRTGKEQMAAICRESDILIAAAGQAGMVDKAFVREGQVILDVGINVSDQGTLCGDVEPAAAEAAAYRSPVPGGVGAVTTAVLMQQVAEAARAAELSK